VSQRDELPRIHLIILPAHTKPTIPALAHSGEAIAAPQPMHSAQERIGSMLSKKGLRSLAKRDSGG
jgi:hypothetical protein